jgi:hypothetical protein
MEKAVEVIVNIVRLYVEFWWVITKNTR